MIERLNLFLKRLQHPTVPPERREEIRQVKAQQKLIERRVRLLELEVNTYRMETNVNR